MGRLLIGLAATLLVAGCQVQVPHRPAAATPMPGLATAAFIPVAESFVEKNRGLKFKHVVNVKYLSDAEFTAQVLAEQRRYRSGTDREGILLRALGLLDPSVDVEAEEEKLLGAGVIGYYNPRTKELAVRGTKATVQVRHALVHELTHALQDQWFSLDTPDNLDGDAEVAFKVLAEGDAVRIEQLYIAGMTADEKKQVSQEGAGGLPAGIPQSLISEIAFPYQAGPAFLKALGTVGGDSAVNDAFLKRPTATAQVMLPNRYTSGFVPQLVPVPAAGDAATSDGVFGDFRLALLLEPLLRTNAITVANAVVALQGWQGDHFVTWRADGKDCVRINFVVDGPATATALYDTLGKFAATRPGVVVTPGSPLSMLSCG